MIRLFKPHTIEQWQQTEDFKKVSKATPREFVELYFNRMPLRTKWQLNKYIFAPFDGIVVHIGKYYPNKDVLNVKGKSYTINEVLDLNMKCDCYACAIFLTAFSVHLGRCPIKGIVRSIKELDPIATENLSMIPAEYDLLTNKKPNPENLHFTFKNERKVIELYEPMKNFDCIVCSIADREVNSILDFVDEDQPVHQGQRLQFVCWGSYTLLVIPVNRKHIKLNPLVKELDYVYAGQTAIFEFAN